MASPTLKVSNPNEGTENPTSPSMDKPKTVATALEKIYYRLGGAGIVPNGTDVATLTWAISDLVGEGGGGSSSGGKAIYLNPTVSGETMHLGKTYNEICELAEGGNNIWVLFHKGILDTGTYIVPLAFYGHRANEYVASVINPIVFSGAISFSSSSQTTELVFTRNSGDDGETS